MRSALDLHDANAALLAAGLGKNAGALERHIRRFEFDSAREVLLTALAQWPDITPGLRACTDPWMHGFVGAA